MICAGSDKHNTLATTTVEPGGPADEELTSTLSYDVFGNRISETISGPGIAPRTESVDYDFNAPNPWHRFPYKLTNALGHSQT